MLKLYDQFEQELLQNIPVDACDFYLSEVCSTLEISETAIQESLARTFRVCQAYPLSIQQHFHKVYREHEGALTADWRISTLGACLFTINADPANPKVAQAQLFLARYRRNSSQRL
jgi:hypothetical protein